MGQFAAGGLEVGDEKDIAKPVIERFILGEPMLWTCLFPELNHAVRRRLNVTVEGDHALLLWV